MAMSAYDEEMMRRKIAEITGRPIPPGMISQTAGASAAAQGAAVDLTGQERGIAAQRAMAAQMRGGGAPKGKTVGPSGLYVAPNWGEHLEHVTGKLAGAYLGKKANEADTELDVSRAKKNRDTIRYEAELLADDRGYRTGERLGGQEHQTGERLGGQAFRSGEREAGQTFDTSERVGGEQFTEGLRQSLQAADQLFATGEREAGEEHTKDTDWDNVPFHAPGDPAKTINYAYNKQTGEYRRGTREGAPVEPGEIESLTPWDTGTGGSMTAADRAAAELAGRDPAKGDGGSNPLAINRILDSGDMLATATGALDPNRWISQLGLEGFEAEQALQMDMGTATLTALSQNMEAIDLKPWSVKEIETISKDVPDKNTQPYGWTKWSAETFRPDFENRFDDAIANEVQTEETKKVYMDQLDTSLVMRAIREDTMFPLDRLEAQGVNPKIIRMGKLILLRRKRDK